MNLPSLELETQVGKESKVEMTTYVLLKFEVGNKTMGSSLLSTISCSNKVVSLSVFIHFKKLEGVYCQA